MKPFWIKSQSIATWKWLSPISPWKMSSWPFTWSKVLQKRCRKVRERCGSPKMVWHCDTSVTYSQAQKTWQGWNSQLWPQQLGSWVPNQTSHQVILLFGVVGVDLGWILKTPGFRNRCGQGPPGFQNHRISFRRLKESICPFGHSKRKKKHQTSQTWGVLTCHATVPCSQVLFLVPAATRRWDGSWSPYVYYIL